MFERITAIRVRRSKQPVVDDIFEIRLANEEVQSTNYVIQSLELGVVYYFYNQSGSVIKVIARHPIYKNPYICSEENDGVSDELLVLPRF
ncbi:DUF3892 domain-containing protein [Vagococcus sp. BWB3-3]|uniref:DUF3892 domain-containing protein n=1 Tax=Vagococcus allomyrinae TaxID=2794353 RepID=A0A940SYG7_9ENTE|nr:DUF3892 domain-containing protein [Vagococcus allomyrinae]MBP1043363.1 DUF3892 domain-containing protein [Vagococcus allomyrinae]